ncbi:MAG: DUF371 domain-containing protein [Nanoarchaeota archaeon]
MKYLFTCYGHENITCTHKTTLEFTKDSKLSLKGDCIVGVKADFQLNKIKEFIKSLGNNRKITIIIETVKTDDNKNFNEKNINNNNEIIEKINAEINPNFNSDKDIVIRKRNFISDRTFAINADKAACELNAGLVNFLKDGNAVIGICLEKHY